jgi:hypothetical protein
MLFKHVTTFPTIPGSSHERVITSIVPHLWQRRQYFPPVYGWSAKSNILLLMIGRVDIDIDVTSLVCNWNN